MSSSGPESVKQQNDEASAYFNNLEELITLGSTENDIKKSLSEIQEKFADYGRDRRSTIDFHIAQLRRCLEPTQTTKTTLWLLNYAPIFYNPDGSMRGGLSDGASALWKDLHDTLNPTQDQCRLLVQLAMQPLNLPQSRKLLLQVNCNNMISKLITIDSSSSSSSSTTNMDLDGCSNMLQRLDTLLSEKNESLDHEMGELQRILSASQIAKFLLWINRNPAVMQMLECLWPHITADDTISKEDSTPYVSVAT